MSTPGMTVDLGHHASLLLASVILITVAWTVGCSQDSPTQLASASQESQKANDSMAQAEKAVAPIDEEAFRKAAFQGELQTVRQALEQQVDIDAVDAEGRTALQLAAYDGHTAVVRHLLTCNPAVDHRDKSGRTALMYAASGSNHETVAVLLGAGADTNLVDSVEGFTALMFAAAEGQLEVVRVLLQHGADVTLTDADGDTALRFAQKNGHAGVAELLNQ